MNIDRKILRICTAAVLCAVFLRVLGNSELSTAVKAISQPELASVALFFQTGRVVRLEDAEETELVPEETIPPQTQPEAEIEPISFSAADASLVEVNDYTGKDPDIETLVCQALNWDLTGDEPTVLILHTHASESYTKTEDYTESSQYRTLNESYNMISIGDKVAEILEQNGICVIHDRSVHDYPSYNGSYSNSRQSAEDYLTRYPSIRLVLDLHRDAAVDSMGNQIGYTVKTEQGKAAKVMLVVGGNNSGWQENMALGVKLQVRLEQLCPEICRPISLRKSKFNQDLSPGAILIEMGAAGNTRQEALLAAEYVAEAIVSLAAGTG